MGLGVIGSGGGQSGNGGQLLVLLYDELRALARQRLSGERANHTLNTTALVNELYLRVSQQQHRFHSEGEFLAAASQIMRRILVDHARAHKADKRGGGMEALPISGLRFDVAKDCSLDIEALDDALTRLSQIDARQARVVEMRFFGGLTELEIAAHLGVSTKTVRRDWATARCWLRSTLAV